MTTAKILCDSLNKQGDRLTTFLITFPRVVEAQFLKHRMFSISSESSRARNLEQHIQDVEEDTFYPNPFTKDCKGMSAKERLDSSENYEATGIVNKMFQFTVDGINELKEIGVHKQHASRYLQPYEYQTMIVTATHWDNFWNLRCPWYEDKVNRFYSKKDVVRMGGDVEDYIQKNTAQPEIMELAELMYDEYKSSVPEDLNPGQFHLPFKTTYQELSMEDQIKCNVAQCARISYKGDGTIEGNLKLFDKLIEGKHWSPLEHVAQAMSNEYYEVFIKGIGGWQSSGPQEGKTYLYFPDRSKGWCNNFKGYIQQRFLYD